MVYVILGEGFEETEAIGPVDILRRGGVEVKLAGIGGLEVKGSHGVRVMADARVEDIDGAEAELIMVPGGLRGVESVKGSPEAMAAIKAAYDAGKRVSAICAGPTVLAKLGIMEGRRGVCYPGMEAEVTGGVMSQEKPAVVDGNVITGRAAGATLDFGLTLLRELRGGEAAKKVAAAIRYDFQG